MIRYVTAETEQYVFCFKALLEFQDTRSLGKLKVGKTVRDEWLKKSEIDVAPWCYKWVVGWMGWDGIQVGRGMEYLTLPLDEFSENL